MCLIKLIKISLFMPLLTGCWVTNRDRNPHNDVLIFGTTTKVALDVSAPVQNAGVPEFTLGYKRLEAVWMPLKPNGDVVAAEKSTPELLEKAKECIKQYPKESINRKDCIESVLPPEKYVSLSAGFDSKNGGNQFEMDTYSVFASLGAKGSLGSSSSGEIAQFFATGIAAQRLGANQQIGLALNTNATKAVDKSAEAQAEKSKEVVALLEAGASPEQATALASGTEENITKRKTEVLLAIGCVSAWDDDVPDNLIRELGSDLFSLRNTDGFQRALQRDDSARELILTECNK
ncbi:MAG: hypothetical protein KDI92_00250 [Xanthomonadales bacterium]|nr:hypothetical protein [Xanthomonadales bacterium]